jgi:NAD(P)-dependent dehydrogenase (short-subunit alcohol dehydrogenase family)
MKTIRGKRALVTGAASGIGRAIALALAREGADLYLVDVNEAALADVVAEAGRHGTGVVGARCDLARPAEVTAAVRGVLDAFGSLDILVNNAGISYHGKTDEMPPDRWDTLLAINLLAPVRLTRELLPTLLERGDAHVLNVCSILGLVTIPRFAAYQTSKFGLVGFSESLRAEFACRGVGVTALCPGFVRTNIYQAMVDGQKGKAMRTPPRWFFASPEAVAAKAVKAIYRNQGLVVVTGLAGFLWFVKRLAPRLWGFATRIRRKKKQATPATPDVAAAQAAAGPPSPPSAAA